MAPLYVADKTGIVRRSELSMCLSCCPSWRGRGKIRTDICDSDRHILIAVQIYTRYFRGQRPPYIDVNEENGMMAMCF